MLQEMGVVYSYTPETTAFTISPMPTAVPGASYQYFAISPATVPDQQTRKNMIAMLMMAKATGAQVTIAYDNTGGFLDQGMIGVYYVTVR
jgi:hypothetical protein